MTAVNFRRTSLIACLGLAAAVAGCGRQESPVARGQYLVAVMGCSDCYTPGGLSVLADGFGLTKSISVFIGMPFHCAMPDQP